MKKITSFTIVLSILVLGFISCKKEKTPDPVTPPTSNALSSSTHKYIKFTLGTTNYTLEAPQNGVWAGGSYVIEDIGIMPNYYKTYDTYQPSPGCFLCVQDSTTQTTRPLSAEYYRNFLSKKDYLFLPKSPLGNTGDCRSRGVYFYTNDNSQVNWSTVNSTNPNSNQNGSTFKIIETAEYTQQSKQQIIFKATFNLKLFNSTGDSVMLTNGEMITSFGNW